MGTGGAAGAGIGGSGGVEGRYVISSLAAPTTSSQARELGCDMDQNGLTDNQLGNVLAALRGMIDTQTGANADLRRGAAITLIGLRGQPDLSRGSASGDLYQGCHEYDPFDPQVAFGGMGAFRATAPGEAFSGTLGGGGAAGGGGSGAATGLDAAATGTLTVPVPIGQLLPISLVAGHVSSVSVSASGLMSGKLCGGITQQDLDGRVIPRIAAMLRESLSMGGSTATTLCQLFDTTDPRCAPTATDCANLSPANPPPVGCLSDTEIRENAIIRSVLKPDVVIGGQRLMSVGLGFTAVHARF